MKAEGEHTAAEEGKEVLARETRVNPTQPEVDAAAKEHVVYDRVAELEQQLQEAEAALKEHKAKLDRQRASNTERSRRYRERHREEYRAYIAEYRRRWRAEQRSKWQSLPESDDTD